MIEKCIVLMPVVDASVPLLERGRSSARRKPVWELKIDLSLEESVLEFEEGSRGRCLIVIPTALVPVESNCLVSSGIHCVGLDLTSDEFTAGSWSTPLHLRSRNISVT